MNLKQIQKFDKLIQKTTNKKLSTFNEITDMTLNLIKMEVNTNQNELMQRVSQHAKFNAVEDFQKFLDGYFEFHNLLIAEFDKLEVMLDDDVFDKKISIFIKNILSIIPKQEILTSLTKFIVDISDVIDSEYPIMDAITSGDILQSLAKMFGSEDIATMYMGLSVLLKNIKENKLSYAEIVETASSVFIFCMVMNSLRKDNYTDSLGNQAATQTAVNSISYNVGRNDPCPCGSGRKYKKCCLNKDKPKILEVKKFDEPKCEMEILTKEEMHRFYSIWSMFINFVSMTYAEVAKEEYIKIYDINDKDEYYLTKEAMKTNHYIIIRNFLNEYFFTLVKHFIEDNADAINSEDIEILMELRESYKNIDAISYEMFSNGNAIFYDLDNQNCFYAHKTFYDYTKAFPKAKTIQAMFFSYKGRIITDGVAASPRIEMGENIQKTMIQEYEVLRENLKFQLEINKPPKQTIYQLKISIKGAKPPIWRRVLVEPDLSLKGLHQIIQDVFDWDDSHLHLFEGKAGNYTDSESLGDGILGGERELATTLHSIEAELKDEKDKINYIYDFGDDWRHEIVLEKVLPYDDKQEYPTCTGGRRAGPLEDCGGIYRYNDIVQAIENPSFENQYVLENFDEEWYEDFNPSEFDKKVVNFFLQEDDWE